MPLTQEQIASFDKQTTDEIGNYFSDYYKEVHGHRPRWISYNDRTALMIATIDLENYMARMKSTKEGRNHLREEGWYIEEFMEEDGWDQKAYDQRQNWLYEDMDRQMEQAYRVHIPDPEDNILGLIKNALTMKWAIA